MNLIDIFLVIICGVAIFASISLYLCGSNFISKTKKGKLILENEQLKETNKLLQEEVQKWKDLALENNIEATRGHITLSGCRFADGVNTTINSFSQMQVNNIKVSKILRKKNNGFKSKKYGDKFEEKYEKLENYDEIIKEYDKLQEFEPYYLEGYADGIADKCKGGNK